MDVVKYCMLAVCSLLLISGQAAGSDSKRSEKAARAKEALAGLDAKIEQALIDFNVPALSVGIVVDGHTILTKGYGFRDVQAKLPATSETLFALGSCTKAFTTFALGMLVEEGLFSWDSPVIDVLPEFRLWDQYATQNLTLRDLVTHRSGLPRHDFMWYNSSHSRQELFKRLRYLEPTCNIRERYNYGNLTYLVAGLVIERAKQTTWEDWISEKILNPLHMKATRFSIEEMQKSNDFAFPYLEKRGVLKKMAFRDFYNVGPAVSMNSNATDMTSWMKLLLAQGTFEGKSLLSSASIQEMFAAQVIVSGYVENKDALFNAYGLGWCIHSYRGHYSVSHDGGPDGFTSVVSLFPYDGIGIVVLSNKNLINLPRYLSLEIADRLLELPSRDWLKDGLEQWNNASQAELAEKQKEILQCKKGTTPSHPLGEYEGKYEHPGYGIIEVFAKGNKLESKFNDITCHLDHWHYDVFSIAEDTEDLIISRKGMKFTFRNNPQGEIDELAIPFEPKAPPIVFRKKMKDVCSANVYLQQFIGTYTIYSITFEFMIRDGNLIALIPGQPIYELVPLSDLEFSVKSMLEYTVRFIKNDAGEITQVLLISPYGAYTATQKT